jgi:hypothetical protein
MESAQVIWLLICGAVIIAGFYLGSHYLDDWKEACINYAKYSTKSQANLEKYKGEKYIDTYVSEIAENLAKKQICFPIWTISFTLVFIFLGIVAWTLFK